MDLSKMSAVLIVKDGGATLKECLNSLKSFGEIILLENESSDDTLEIAKEFQKSFPQLRVEKSKFLGFGALKNLALSYAKNEWIFNIDADEVLEPSCLQELAELECEEEHIIALPRKNLYKKEWIKACGWYPDFVLRIFNKNFTRFNENAVHESLELPPNAKILRLKEGLKHYAYENIYSLLQKGQLYSTLWAQQNLHKNSSMSKSLLRSGWKFLRDYFLKKGFLYGYKGFVISFFNALGVFLKYSKLYELKIDKIKSCALIITTYNQKERLALVLDSVKKLLILPDEVLIADDGSKEDTAELIKAYQKDFPCPLKHIWQEDRGYRLAQSRNKAIHSSCCEYVIVIDGDMILEPHFIKDHLNFAQHKVFLQGGRIILDKTSTERYIHRGGHKLVFSPKAFRIGFLSKMIYKNSKLTKDFFEKKKLIKGIRGCNMSFYKKDFEDLEGFNENFVGWGREDSEFVARFLFNGGEFRRLKFCAIAYHLHHEENSKALLKQNDELYLKTVQNKIKSWKNAE